MERYGRSFKELNKKEKVAFIWEYYRWYIAAVIIGIAVIGSLVTTMLRPREVYDVDVLICGKMNYGESQPEVIKEYKDMFGAKLGLSIVDWEHMGEMEMAMLSKIPLLIKTNELDILGLEPDTFESYVRQLGADVFIQLDTVPELAELLEKYKEKVYISGYKMNDEEELIEVDDHIYGIRVSKFKNIPCITENEEFILGITSTVKDMDKTIKVLEYLLEE